MSILGENFVILQGKISWPKAQLYDDSMFFRCSIAVPIDDKFQYIKVSTWGKMAETLAELPPDTWIKVYGHIEESSYMTNCKYCQAESRAYWTSVTIDNYITLQGD